MEKKNSKSGNLSFCITIPTINRVDLLLPSLLMYAINMPDTPILIYDNGKQGIEDILDLCYNSFGLGNFYKGIPNIRVFGGVGENIGVAASWNFLCQQAFEKHSHVLMLNDDIFLNVDEYDLICTINRMANDFTDFICCEDAFDRSAFIISKNCFDIVGQFDDNFYPAYYEDVDYLRRVDLAKKKLIIDYKISPMLNPQIFRRSSSIIKDGSIVRQENKEINRKYYIVKWGGDVGEEKYSVPFG